MRILKIVPFLFMLPFSLAQAGDGLSRGKLGKFLLHCTADGGQSKLLLDIISGRLSYQRLREELDYVQVRRTYPEDNLSDRWGDAGDRVRQYFSLNMFRDHKDEDQGAEYMRIGQHSDYEFTGRSLSGCWLDDEFLRCKFQDLRWKTWGESRELATLDFKLPLQGNSEQKSTGQAMILNSLTQPNIIHFDAAIEWTLPLKEDPSCHKQGEERDCKFISTDPNCTVMER